MFNFHSLDVDVRGRTSGLIKTFCPRCREQRKNKRDKSLSVNIDQGKGKCHYCEWAFVLDDGSKPATRGTYGNHGTSQPSATHPPKPPAHFRRPVFDGNHTQLSDRLLRWFITERCIPQQVLADMLVSEQEETMPQTGHKENCICFNYFERGQLVNIKYRDGAKNFKMVAGAELIPYNIDGILSTPEAIITEGEIDAFSFMAIGRKDTVSVPAGANRNLAWLDRFVETHFDDKKCIYLATDDDDKGHELRHELLRRLGPGRCRILGYGPDCKDANEHLVRYGAESLRIALAQAQEIPLKGVVTATDLATELRALYENGFGPGADTGLENLDALCTFELGRLLVVSGVPGHGKSEFVDEIVLQLCLRHNWPIAYFSPENTPVTYHLRKLAEKLTACRFQPGTGMTEAVYSQVTSYLANHVCHIQPTEDEHSTLETILQKARELVARRGIRTLVIDPLNRIEQRTPPGMTELQYISDLLNQLSAFALRQGCLVVLVAHPRKLNRNPLTQKRPVAEMYDINGSAEFFNKADFGMVVERDDEARVVRLHVHKVKFKHLGRPGTASFVYDMVSGRYSPCQENTDPSTLPENRVYDTKFDTHSWLPEEGEKADLFNNH